MSTVSRRLVAAATAIAVVAVVVALATGALEALAALTVVPLAVASFATGRVTAAAAALTALVALAAGLAHDALGGAHVAALVAIGFAGTVAAALAALARRREEEGSFTEFLGEAGTLLACSLDFDETAKAAASVPVPQLADWVLVELYDSAGAIERRAASHADEGAEAVAAALSEAQAADGRSTLSALWPHLPDELVAPGEGREARPRAAMRVPLRSADRPVGAMTLLALEPGRSFGETDLRHAEQLAARVAIAIDNALLYRAARRGERRFTRRTESPERGRPQQPHSGE